MLDSFVLPFPHLESNKDVYFPGFRYIPTLCFASMEDERLVLHFFSPEVQVPVVPQQVRLTTFCDPRLIKYHQVQHILPIYSYKDYASLVPLHTDEQQAVLNQEQPDRGRDFTVQRFGNPVVMGFAYLC